MWGVISASYQSRAPLEKVMTSRTELWRVLLITQAFNISSLISESRCFTATLCFNPLYALCALHDYHRPLCLQFKRACWTELMGPLTRIRVVSSTPSRRVCVFDLETVSMSLRPLVTMIHRLERIEGILWFYRNKTLHIPKYRSWWHKSVMYESYPLLFELRPTFSPCIWSILVQVWT